ncbi:hypothetical protein GCM10027456_07360 [Kineosporia babensis]
MSSNSRPPEEYRQLPSEELAGFVSWFMAQESVRERFRWVLRDSLDELLDGQRTGRWSYGHLTKTEKSHLGTTVEVNLTKEFAIVDGSDLDWKVQGKELDCKFSKDFGGWEIPMEMYKCEAHAERSGKQDYPALLVWMSDDSSEWAVGLISVTDERLRWKKKKQGEEPARAYNRDNKRKIDPRAYKDIYWFWGGIQNDLPVNTLLNMDEITRSRIFSDETSGQRRVNELFVCMQGEIIRRPVVLTVGQQDDAPKRARDARDQLRDRGYLILGHQEVDPIIALRLGLPQCAKGEWLAVRLAPVEENDGRRKTLMGKKFWAIAEEHEPETAIPKLPRGKQARFDFLNVTPEEIRFRGTGEVENEELASWAGSESMAQMVLAVDQVDLDRD